MRNEQQEERALKAERGEGRTARRRRSGPFGRAWCSATSPSCTRLHVRKNNSAGVVLLHSRSLISSILARRMLALIRSAPLECICSPSASALQSRTHGRRRFQLDDCSTSEALCGSTHTGPLRAAAHWLGYKSPQRPAADRCGRAWPATGLPAMRREMLPNIIICRRVCACNSIRDASLGLPFGALISSARFGPQCRRRQVGHLQSSTRTQRGFQRGRWPPAHGSPRAGLDPLRLQCRSADAFPRQHHASQHSCFGAFRPSHKSPSRTSSVTASSA
jgi:hypothetical protein